MATPSNRVPVTANFAQTRVHVTGTDDSGFSISTMGSTLGGGTLTLAYKPVNDERAAVDLDTLLIDEASQYWIGADMEVFLTLSGATAPSFDYIIGRIK